MILDEEPDLSKGVAAALKLASIKGYSIDALVMINRKVTLNINRLRRVEK